MKKANVLINDDVYDYNNDIYKNKSKLYMKHTIEMFTPLDKIGLSELEAEILLSGQLIESDRYKDIIKNTNEQIFEDLNNTFESDIGKIETIITKEN